MIWIVCSGHVSSGCGDLVGTKGYPKTIENIRGFVTAGETVSLTGNFG